MGLGGFVGVLWAVVRPVGFCCRTSEALFCLCRGTAPIGCPLAAYFCKTTILCDSDKVKGSPKDNSTKDSYPL